MTQLCCRYDDDGPAVRNEEEDFTSTKSQHGTSRRFAGKTGIPKVGNILMEHLVMIFTPSRKRRRRRRKRKGAKAQNIPHKDQDPFTKVFIKIYLS